MKLRGPLFAAAIFLALYLVARAAPGAIPPESVAVLYNSSQDSSRSLALHYATRRKIPLDNLVGLALPEAEEITRAQYDESLRMPLTRTFDEKKWWDRKKNGAGALQPATSKIRILVCMHGVPLKIKRAPAPPADDKSTPPKKGPSIKQDEASVDSELSLLGISEYKTEGPLNNPYYKAETTITKAPLNGILLVGRIDAPTVEICKRMVNDAADAERDGLWGMCYLDLAKKGGAYKVGDDWIESIATQNAKVGIPTVIDRNRDTFVTNYPMRDASLYYGWYAGNRNGPLLNPAFSFRKGAVAVHLHSFSASKLRQTSKYWCGPILEKGAAATLGNVYEPFLQMTHNFDIFHERLLEGYTLIEAAGMAMPVLSWQGVVLGDPLYRPFATLDTPPNFKTSQPAWEFKALRQAWIEWGDDEETRVTKLRSAAARHNSGRIYEALGLNYISQDKPEQASAFFASAGKNYQSTTDQLRQDLHLVDLARQAGRKQDAITRLRTVREQYAEVPGAKAITGLLNILDPPPPPPVTEKSAKGKPKDKK